MGTSSLVPDPGRRVPPRLHVDIHIRPRRRPTPLEHPLRLSPASRECSHSRRPHGVWPVGADVVRGGSASVGRRARGVQAHCCRAELAEIPMARVGLAHSLNRWCAGRSGRAEASGQLPLRASCRGHARAADTCPSPYRRRLRPGVVPERSEPPAGATPTPDPGPDAPPFAITAANLVIRAVQTLPEASSHTVSRRPNHQRVPAPGLWPGRRNPWSVHVFLLTRPPCRPCRRRSCCSPWTSPSWCPASPRCPRRRARCPAGR